MVSLAQRPAIDALVRNARENEAKLQKFQSTELRLIEAHSFPDLYVELTQAYPRAFDLDRVVLALADPDHEIARLLGDYDRGADFFASLRLVSSLEERRRLAASPRVVALRRYDPRTDAWLFTGLDPAPKSIAALPLERRGQIIGSLTLGSHHAARFGAGMHTAFLDRLAAIAGICIENTLNVHRLRSAGLTDPLTGVRNRRFLDERLVEEVARARRHGTPLACLFIDIDRFKRLNDRHGHATGDVVLQGVAARIAASLRMTDLLTRYGGEEFAVLQPGTDLGEAQRVAERILRSIAGEPFRGARGDALSLTVSIGVASLEGVHGPDDLGGLSGALTHAADEAMLEAKRRGRNGIAVARTRAG